MAEQPRGRPPSQAPPDGRGRNALTALGGGVLVLAVAGGAWALFGRDSTTTDTAAIGPKVPTSSANTSVFGPVGQGGTPTPAVTATSTRPVAVSSASAAAATTSPTPAPSKAAVATKAPTAAPSTAPPVATPPVTAPVATPPVTGPQRAGAVAKKAYTFKVARGDTLWDLTEKVLAATGRSTSTASIAAHVFTFHESNQDVIGSDPDLILPGQVLVWPAGL